ncbi:MAG: hypothetical protein ACD_78C00300G0001 [uncultured bacterium (gcode 4)]|uniref:Uncharacterized protein n=1 Tax=uncultured bacterium (gcode 4) TaxID=1234023 RepID=K1YWS1_9BACT|nr:MAG: hypothetical protein ACD_78C00300G0001 [uncultured bacterium (gcode 4)]
MEDDIARFLRKFLIGHIHRDLVRLARGSEDLHIVDMIGPREDRPLSKGQARIDDFFFEKCYLGPESMTTLTGPIMRIKRKIGNGEILLYRATERTRGFFRKYHSMSRINPKDFEYPIPRLVCELERISETFRETFVILFHDQPIDDDMWSGIFGELHIFEIIRYRKYLIIHLESDKPTIEDISLDRLDVIIFPLDYRRENMDFGPFWQVFHIRHHHWFWLFFEGDLGVIGTGLHPDGRVEEAVKIINLRDRPDRRTRIIGSSFLIDTDCRREPADLVHLGIFVDRGDNHPSVRRETLEIASLSLGIDGIECKRWLSRPRNSRDNDEFVFGDFDGNILEIVRLGTDNFEELGHKEKKGEVIKSNGEYTQKRWKMKKIL